MMQLLKHETNFGHYEQVWKAIFRLQQRIQPLNSLALSWLDFCIKAILLGSLNMIAEAFMTKPRNTKRRNQQLQGTIPW